MGSLFGKRFDDTAAVGLDQQRLFRWESSVGYPGRRSVPWLGALCRGHRPSCYRSYSVAHPHRPTRAVPVLEKLLASQLNRPARHEYRCVYRPIQARSAPQRTRYLLGQRARFR